MTVARGQTAESGASAGADAAAAMRLKWLKSRTDSIGLRQDPVADPAAKSAATPKPTATATGAKSAKTSSTKGKSAPVTPAPEASKTPPASESATPKSGGGETKTAKSGTGKTSASKTKTAETKPGTPAPSAGTEGTKVAETTPAPKVGKTKGSVAEAKASPTPKGTGKTSSAKVAETGEPKPDATVKPEVTPAPKGTKTKGAVAEATPKATGKTGAAKVAQASEPKPEATPAPTPSGKGKSGTKVAAASPTPAPPKKGEPRTKVLVETTIPEVPTRTPPQPTMEQRMAKLTTAKARLNEPLTNLTIVPDKPQPPDPRLSNLRIEETRPGRGFDRYRWKPQIVTTVFWIGEPVGGRNMTPNFASSWDAHWTQAYGGFDDPNPAARRNYIPIRFTPRQNPFYIALPYNDVTRGTTKPESRRVIPWFREAFRREGQSVCRDRWVAVRNRSGKIAYAQWSDCGPFRTDHWQYVFGNERPLPNLNQGAGLDVSPAVRDYLDLQSTDVTDWKFVDARDVPNGPWCLYGDNNVFAQRGRSSKPGGRTASGF